MNIEQMTQKTREALQAAQRIAVEYSNNAVEQEHLLGRPCPAAGRAYPAAAADPRALTPMPLPRRPCRRLRSCPA